MRHFAGYSSKLFFVLLALGALLQGAPVHAQSLLANRGLGLVVQPADARANALGGIDLGLVGGDFSWENPADLVGLPAAGMRFAFQYDDVNAEFAGQTSQLSTARFPLIQIATPIGDRWAASVGFGGFLDQNWRVERQDTLVLGGDSVEVLDRLTSEGGVARLRFGVGYRLIEKLSIGLGADVYTGEVQRDFGRRFPGQSEAGCCRTDWRYSGLGMLAGINWVPSEAIRVGASASLGGTLDATPEDTLATASSFELPMVLQGGASARIASSLLLAVGADWAEWSSLDAPLTSTGGARDSWSVQGGLEWDGLRLRDRPLPVRLGARHTELPFRWGQPSDPTDWANERALTSGLGLVLGGGATLMDVALERGWRGGSAAGLEESFWRVSLSVTVLGR